jgi:hypothetical protein
MTTRARRAKDVLADLAADRLAVPSPVTTRFVSQSVAAGRRGRRRRRNRIVAAAAALVLAAAAFMVVAPKARLAGMNNRASIVNTGDGRLLDELPTWVAANSAAVLLHGTSRQKALARRTLTLALSHPKPVSLLQWSDGHRRLRCSRTEHERSCRSLGPAPRPSRSLTCELALGSTARSTKPAQSTHCAHDASTTPAAASR